MKSPVTTHILDTAKGRPASGVPVVLRKLEGDSRSVIAKGETDDDGRIMNWFTTDGFVEGVYQIEFDTKSYLGAETFYPSVTIDFEVKNKAEHYHVPLLLNPYGFTTYRGS